MRVGLIGIIGAGAFRAAARGQHPIVTVGIPKPTPAASPTSSYILETGETIEVEPRLVTPNRHPEAPTQNREMRRRQGQKRRLELKRAAKTTPGT